MLDRIRALTGRNIKEILRDPLSLLFMLAIPLLMELLFYFAFHSATDQFQMRYLAPGIAVFAQAFCSLFAGLLIALDRASAFLTRLFVSPAGSGEFICGYLLALLPLSLVQSALFFLVGGTVDPSLFGWGMALALPASLIPAVLFISFGILFGTLCSEKAVGGVASAMIMGQSLLSGMWYPREGLSDGIVTLMNCLPFKNAVDLMQNLVNGEGEVLRPLLIVAAYSAAAFAAAVFCFRLRMRAK